MKSVRGKIDEYERYDQIQKENAAFYKTCKTPITTTYWDYFFNQTQSSFTPLFLPFKAQYG